MDESCTVLAEIRAPWFVGVEASSWTGHLSRVVRIPIKGRWTELAIPARGWRWSARSAAALTRPPSQERLAAGTAFLLNGRGWLGILGAQLVAKLNRPVDVCQFLFRATLGWLNSLLYALLALAWLIRHHASPSFYGFAGPSQGGQPSPQQVSQL